MADKFWELAKEFNMNQKTIKNGFMLKSEFCKKHNISLKKFDDVLLKNKYKTKEGMTIGNKYIKKRSGSWQKGIYQYNEKHFLELLTL